MQLKKKVNLHLVVIHCIAHRTNVVSLEATKEDGCSLLSNEVDNIINSVAVHFRSLQRESPLYKFCR